MPVINVFLGLELATIQPAMVDRQYLSLLFLLIIS